MSHVASDFPEQHTALPQSREEDMHHPHDSHEGDYNETRADNNAPNEGDYKKDEEEPGMMAIEDRREGDGGPAVRPIFFGNLSQGCLAADVEAIFEHPVVDVRGGMEDHGDPRRPIALERVDMKRGYCFVFLRDVATMAEKERIENYVNEINGMNINMVSKALRAEFARGDGRIKRKEDERRKKISPSETLFVVNFHEVTTKREDLEMLFAPFGELLRIDMKRNYAFVQFRTVEQAQAAKDATNGGKLDQSEITVEFVARRVGEDGGRFRGDRRRDDFRGDYRGPRRDDSRGPRRDRDYRRDDDYRGGRSGYGGPRDRDYRRRSRSRSRSPPGYRYDRRRSRSHSPDDRHRPSSSYRRNSRSPGKDYEDRRGGRGESYGGRGYRSERGYGEEAR